MTSGHRYGYEDGAPPVPPNYTRVVVSLSDADLEDEILAGFGEPGYRAALLAEAERRAKTTIEGGS